MNGKKANTLNFIAILVVGLLMTVSIAVYKAGGLSNFIDHFEPFVAGLMIGLYLRFILGSIILAAVINFIVNIFRPKEKRSKEFFSYWVVWIILIIQFLISI